MEGEGGREKEKDTPRNRGGGRTKPHTSIQTGTQTQESDQSRQTDTEAVGQSHTRPYRLAHKHRNPTKADRQTQRWW